MRFTMLTCPSHLQKVVVLNVYVTDNHRAPHVVTKEARWRSYVHFAFLVKNRLLVKGDKNPSTVQCSIMYTNHIQSLQLQLHIVSHKSHHLQAFTVVVLKQNSKFDYSILLLRSVLLILYPSIVAVVLCLPTFL